MIGALVCGCCCWHRSEEIATYTLDRDAVLDHDTGESTAVWCGMLVVELCGESMEIQRLHADTIIEHNQYHDEYPAPHA